MTTFEFLSYLRSLGVKVWAEGDKLRYQALESALLPSLKAELAKRKSDILQVLGELKTNAQPARLSIRPIAEGHQSPLSFSQQRLWFLNQVEPDSSFYTELVPVRMKGRLDVSVMERTLSEIVRRHEAVRTIFPSVDGHPTQVIQPAHFLKLRIDDLSLLPQDERELEVQQLIKAEARRPFDLAQGPLMRVRLLRLSLNEYVMMVAMHHIITDGWSMGVLVREVGALYQAFASGNSSPLSELPIQYADYARWQRQWMSGEVLESQLRYWRQQLVGELPVLDLPTDRPRPAKQSFNGARHTVALGLELSRNLEAMSREQGVTLFMTLLATFQILLHRYTSQTDVRVGSPVANRTRAETEELIGLFVNTLVLRADLSGNPSFCELLGRVRETALGAYAHQELPFEKLVEELNPERDLSYTPLFQVMFVLQNAPMPALELSGLELTQIEIEPGTARFDLEFVLVETAEGLRGWFEYNTALFDEASIDRMCGRYRRLLVEAVAKPEERLSNLPLLTEAEREQIVVTWNQTARPYPEGRCVHELFAEQAARVPERMALVCEEQQVSYGELDRRANQLAHYLRRQGGGPEVLVGLCLERSIEMVIAILGILKAGAAYLPIDTADPRQRMESTLEDAQAKLLLTQERLLGLLGGQDQEIVCLDRDWGQIGMCNREAPVTEVRGEEIAYVIYTSGSTGAPKGAMNTHSGIRNRLLWMQETYQLNETDRVLQKTTFSFDVSVWEFLWPLMTGAVLVMARPGGHKDSEYLLRVIREAEITTIHFVPSMLAVFLEEQIEKAESLRRVICSGEALTKDLERKLRSRTRAQVSNLYGPTEAAIDVTYWISEGGAEKQVVPIGRPIANIQMYVLDRELEPAPIGVRGEIYISGIGLARGYVRRPELTGEKFIPHRFGRTRGERLYRTGDVGRYLSDGNIEFIGRADNQVKLRGYRIELGEIEHAIIRHPAVSQSVVLLREDHDSDKRLVAYVVRDRKYEDIGRSQRDSQLGVRQVSQWQVVFDQTYDSTVTTADPKFNLSGWNSSYTGQPIADEEMREWLDDTVNKILPFQPDRVLEIGCGTGLVLFRVAPYCSQYWGTDFSQQALSNLDRLLRSKPDLSQVTLTQRSAENFEGIEPESFDTVILNSVVQYFPSIDYLVDVLGKAVRSVKSGGRIMVGDVRSLPLLKAFHTSVQFHHAPSSLSARGLSARARRSQGEDRELVIDPKFFIALTQQLPRIKGVEIYLKDGRHHNELTRYRYGVILHISDEVIPSVEYSWLDWRSNSLSLDAVERILSSDGPEVLAIRRVPNARLVAEQALLEMLAVSNGAESVGDLRDRLQSVEASGIEPDDLSELGRRLNYRVGINWSGDGSDGRFDVLFIREGAFSSRVAPFAVGTSQTMTEVTGGTWSKYANDPLQTELEASLVTELREYVKQSLPEYMTPSAFVVMAEMPLTPNGKVDRRSLPDPEVSRSEEREGYVAPRTPVEEMLAGIFEGVLKLDRVGRYDNFFEIGGHSLLATQVISRVRNAFGVEIGVRSLFEATTVESLGRRIEEAMRAGEVEKAPPLVRASRDGRLPLSFAQQRLWFLDQLVPNNPFYNIPGAVRLKGGLNLEALERVINEIVRRHETLRTRIEVEEGVPVQVVDEWEPRRLEVEDLTSLTQEEGEKEVRRMAKEEARTGFDLSRDPMLRVKVLKLGVERHVMLLTMHHIVSDEWSLEILIREVGALYRAYLAGEESPLEELPIQYADFAVWQREWLKGEALERELEYWRRQLAGTENLQLPTDRPRPAAPSYRGARRHFVIERELTEKLRALGQREGATLFMTLLGGFDVLMSRYSGQQDVALGTNIANRNRAEIEGLIGFFVNQLVLRVEAPAAESFRELLARVREVCLGAYAHQDAPFEKLVEELQPERDLSRSPLFQAKLLLQHASREGLELVGTRLSIDVGEVETAKIDLTVEITDEGRDLIGAAEYSQDLFEAETIERLMSHYANVLRGIVEDSERPISQLSLLNEAEREQIVVEWNQTAVSYSKAQRIHELFTEQAERIPERVALISERHQVSYGELNRRANQLAQYLQGLGVGPEMVVGIFLERSVEMVVAVMGVLKAGGTYLPLDPESPLERLSYVLKDAGVVVALTQQVLEERLPAFLGQTICLDLEQERICEESESEPESKVVAENLAYVIYTSGSTGRPKGVMINHGGLTNYLKWATDAYRIEEGEGAPVQSSIGFDLTVTSLYGPLVNGKSVNLLSEEEGIEALATALSRESGYSLVKITPAHLDVLAQQLENSDVEGRAEVLVIGGEELRAAGLKYWQERAPETRLINEYGPTETVVGCCVYEVKAGERVRETAPIGRPIANVQMYILDEELEPAPVGVKGELYISGAGVARGYLRKPGLTAERFIPNRFGREGGERMYRTGDFGRYVSDGNIEFLGRADDQVKVRGYRVELGEIEAALDEHRGVRQSVVVAREDERGGKRLMGYVVGQEGVTAPELKRHIRERLPEYMVPEAIVVLKEMPLTAHGKIDRKRLPLLTDAGRHQAREGLAPRTPAEEMLVGIFEDVLKIDRVGIHDNFFDIGGHSLLATRLISRVRDTFGVKIGVKAIFEQPTPEGLARRIEAAMKSGEEEEGPPLVRAPRREKLPLSFAQQRLWFIDQLEPGNSLYICPGALRLEGRLNLEALESAINEIVRRHEALRTRIEVEDGQPVQVIEEWEPRRLEVEDLTGRTQDEKEEEVRRISREEMGTGFDLSRGPLLRVKALKLAPEEHALLFTMHHIVSDWWSMGVLMREVCLLYEAMSEGKQSPMPELEIQYADYAKWQREYLSGEVLEREVEYWKEQLKDATVMELPTDHARPAAPSYRGGRERIEIAKETSEGLKRLSQREGVTLFMVLMTAFKLILMRYSGEEDISVGTPIANRTRREVEGLIGFFVNTLVLRTNLGGNPSFRELIRREREVSLGAYGHQEAPFEKLVEEINPDRDLSRSPLFQVMMVFQNTRREESRIKGPENTREKESRFGRLKVSLIEGGGTGAAKFDLTLGLTEGEEGITGSLEYNKDLFEGETIRRMARHYEKALEEVVKDPKRQIRNIDLMSEEEKEQVIVEFNRTKRRYEREQPFHELIERQVGKREHATAVVFEEEQLTYSELNARANQLANYLRKLGVGPEVLVGLCMERSIEMVVGLLGILKAGGAYAPLDPSYPSDRLSFMLEVAQAPFLLTQERLLPSLSTQKAQIICLDKDWSEIGIESAQNPESQVSFANAAYVIFTSGSTGRPKGVVISHGAIANHMLWMQEAFPLDEDDRVAQKTPFSFDASVWEFYAPLLVGGMVVMARPGGQQDSAYLVRLVVERDVTILQLVPSMLRVLMEEPEIVKCQSLKRVFCGGEALTPDLRDQFFLRMSAELHNLYGPAEATIDATSWSCRRDETTTKEIVPIGRPIANAEAYVLDEWLESAPIGVVGELYLGGYGIGRGYLRGPEMTAEKFIPHRFSSESGERLYKTGDLVRYLPEGKLDYLGRADEQVKFRGFRIELGEIEKTLEQEGWIRKAVVVVREDNYGDKRLVAYVVVEGEGNEKIRRLRDYLKKKLPEYMIPSVFVEIENIPLTPNGKLDRKALPQPRQEREQEGVTYVGANTPVEEILLGILEEMLELDQIGIHDNFFEIGGHSLIATRVVSRLRNTFGVELGVRSIFEEPTVEGLARKIDEMMRAGERTEAAPLIRVSREGQGAERLPLSFAQQRLWFLDQLAPNNPFYNVPGAVRLDGKLNLDALEGVINEIVKRHEVLRTRFEVELGEPIQVIDNWEFRKLHVEDLTGVSQEEKEEAVSRISRDEAGTGFDLSRGPLLRVKVLKLEEEQHVILFTMHHIVSDAWSMGILIREVGALYQAYSAGEPSPLPELEIQYADHAVWQRNWLQGGALERQLSYWRRQLAGMEDLELPIDHPRPAVRSYRGASQRFVVGREVAERLRALCQREEVTLFMLLLAGFDALMSRYSGQQDVVLGTDIANRNRAEIEGLIGFFVNQLVMRVEVKPRESFSELLKRVREVCLGAYAHQDLPFEKLVEELQPERDLSRSPLFQAKLLLQTAPRERLAIEGTRLKKIGGAEVQARVDLTVSITDAGRDLVGVVNYRRDLFEEETIKRLMDHYTNLLRGIVEDGERQVYELPLLSDQEREQIVVEWNQTARPYPQDRCVHELFREQAERTPERIALICEGREVSYGELNRRANQVAHYLQRLGVGPEVVVGLFLERSVEMMAAVMGALKSGGAYLPLDPESPLERVGYMLEDAGAGVVLTEQALEARLPAYWGQTVCMDQEWERISEESESEPESEVVAENLAYVIYTSGSTGKPKGVMVRHRSLVNYTHDICRQLGLEEGAEVEGLQFATVSTITADLGNTCIYPSLLSGGSLHVLSYESATDGRRFKEYLRVNPIDVLKIVPSHLGALLGMQPNEERMLPLKYVILGGESLTQEMAEQIRELGEGCEVINHYGPTETTVGSLTARVSEVKVKDRRGASVPIGRPIGNTKTYVLDRELEPVPVGVRGELYISGVGVARGYRGKPEQTAERFIANVHGGEEGERLYRTGDVCRYLSDGRIEYIGRSDDQVKVRGYRIELGEIQAVLEEQRSVKQSVVIASQDERGGKRLVGYVVCEGATTSAELKRALREKLPEYMVPEAILTLDEMPLTRNGKVDRKRLPSVKDAGRQGEQEYVGARTPVEEIAVGIFEEVLRQDRVGVHDNFFEIGGHSLLATQVISRVRNTFGVEIGVGSVFEEPTVESLARRIEEAIRRGEKVEAPPLVRVSREGQGEPRLPLSFAQQRLWFLDQLVPNDPFYNCPRAVRLEGRLDLQALERSINEIIRRHEVLRTRIEVEAGEPVQVIEQWKRRSLQIEDLTSFSQEEREQEARRITKQEAATGFDLSRGPLLRVKVLKLAEEEHISLFTTHHIVSDAWSMGILIREVGALYRAYSAGEPSPLPELEIQYADFAVWQRNFLQGEALERQLGYWRKQLAGLEPLELPLDYPRPAVAGYRGANLSFELSQELTDGLKALSRREGVTLFMTLLAAFKTLLYKYTAQEDIIVGTAVANRSRVEVEPLIGFFLNMLPLRTDLSRNPGFTELLKRVRDVAIGGYAHQDMPFEKLVKEIQPERTVREMPLFNVAFGVQNAPEEELKLNGIEVRPIVTEQGDARYDLTLWVREGIQGLRVNWTYSKDLFEEGTIVRMHNHFETLLSSIIDRPDARLSILEISDGAETRPAHNELDDPKGHDNGTLMSIRRRGTKLPTQAV